MVHETPVTRESIPERKVCSACQRDLPASEYHTRIARTVRYLQSCCRSCSNVASIASRARQTPRVRRYFHVRQQFGLSPEEYDALVDRHRDGCAICGEPANGSRSLAVDHNHATGKVRGMLCLNCNRGLGVFRDDPALLMQAARYLRAANRRRGV